MHNSTTHPMGVAQDTTIVTEETVTEYDAMGKIVRTTRTTTTTRTPSRRLPQYTYTPDWIYEPNRVFCGSQTLTI